MWVERVVGAALAAAPLVACVVPQQTGSRLPDGTLTEFTGATWMQDAVAIPWTAQSNGSSKSERARSTLEILFSDQPEMCAQFHSDTRPANAKFLKLVVTVEGEELPRPGAYRIRYQALPTAYASYMTSNENCEQSADPHMGEAGGFVTFDEVTPTVVTGSYKLWFRFGHRMEGTFRAGVCDVVKKRAPRVCR